MNESKITSLSSISSIKNIENIELKESRLKESINFNINELRNEIIHNKNKNKINNTVIISPHKKEELFLEINNNIPHISLNLNYINNINEINNIKENSSLKNSIIPDFKKLWKSFSSFIKKEKKENDDNDNDNKNNDSTNNKKEEPKCMICSEILNEEEKINNKLECKHLFCDDCYFEFLKENINTNFIEKIKCPYKNCSTKLYNDFIERIL